tara:strand:+ start:28 stop:447 length:420 start_codon:yes stop_codon:yes gene_type:complete
MKKLIIAIGLSICPTSIFSQDTIDSTINPIAIDTSFPIIYYKNGTIANPDSIGRACSITLESIGIKIKGISLWECSMYSYNGDEDNIIDLEKVDRLEKTGGEIISGEMAIKKLRKYQMIFNSTTFITVGGIIISLLLFA